MSYNKTIWHTGDIVHADELNNIEDGIKKVDEKLERIEDGAQVNVIEGIQFNGTDVTPDSETKKVNISAAPYDLAVPTGTSEDIGKILEKNSKGFGWIDKPLDGADAYGVYVKQYDEQHPDDPQHQREDFMNRDEWLEYIRGKSAREIYNATYNKNLNDAQFVAELKTSYPMFHVDYNASNAGATIGVLFSGNLDPTGDDIAADETTMGKLYLMPDAASDPENCIGFVTVLDGQDYKWCNVGAISIPSDALAKSDVDNECVDGATDEPASAKVVMDLKAKLEGVTASEIKVTQQPITGSYVKGADGTISTASNVAYIEIAVGSNKKVRFLGAWFALSGYTSGYAFGHYTDESDTTTWVTDRSAVFDTNASVLGTKEYVISVPEGATHFRTTTATGSIPSLAQDFYCYLQSGESVVDTIDNAVKPANVKLFGEYQRIQLGEAKNGRITQYDKWSEGGKHYTVDVSQYQGETIKVVAVETGSLATQIAFLTQNPDNLEENNSIPYCENTGRTLVSAGTTKMFVIPETCNYLYVLRWATDSNSVVTPKSVSLVISLPIEDEITNTAEAKVHELTDDRLDALEEEVFDVYEDIELGSYKSGRIIINGGKFTTRAGGTYYLVDVSSIQGEEIIITANASNIAYYAFLEEALPNTTDSSGIIPSYVPGTSIYSLGKGKSTSVVIPNSCIYMYVNRTTTTTANRTPSINRIVSVGFETKITERLDKVEKSIETVGKDNEIKERLRSTESVDDKEYIVTLLHFSDIHGSATNMQRILDFYNEYKKENRGGNGYIDNIISTGDLVYDKFSDSIDSMLNIEGGNEILNVIGNHETRVYNGQETNWFGATMEQCYDKFIAPYKDNWLGDVHTTTDKTYYYVDYVTTEDTTIKRNVRLIVYDIMHYDDSGQNAWLESTLEDARENGMHVMIALHSATQNTEHYDASVPSTFTTIGFTPSTSSVYIKHDIKPIVKQFIDEGGIFICYIAGHYHRDYIGRPTTDGFTDQYTFAVSTANSTTKESHDFVRDSNSDLFNVISINTRRKVMSIFRVGSSIDVFNRKVESLVFNYNTHEIIYQS